MREVEWLVYVQGQGTRDMAKAITLCNAYLEYGLRLVPFIIGAAGILLIITYLLTAEFNHKGRVTF